MLQIKNILCPIDFSGSSRHTFDRAIGVARCHDARISVLHVLPLPSAVPVIRFGPEGPGPLGLHGDRDHVLAEIPRFLDLDHPVAVPIEYHVVEASSTPKEIVVQASRLAADLVVIGTHGHSGFERLVLGSVAEKVLRTSMVPVLTVPPHVSDVTPSGRCPFLRILYATDFSPGSDVALRHAASLAEHGAAELTIIHVVEPFPVGDDPIVGSSFNVAAYHAALEKEAITKLRTLVPENIRLGCDIHDLVTKGKPYVEILRTAAERRSDLIVLGVHGRNALDRLVFGSTTEHIVRRATCPVLTVRAPEDPRR